MDTQFEKLSLSDRMAPPAHHNDGTVDRDLNLPPNNNNNASSQQQQQYFQHQAPLAAPGIMVDGTIWEEEEDEDDIMPLRNQRPHPTPMTSTGLPRPVSIRNLAAIQSNSARPARFIKANQPMHTPLDPSMPTELQMVQRLYDQYHAKVYIEGYLYKKVESTTGKRSVDIRDSMWIKSYVELAGPVLTAWDADKEDDGTDVMPQYINIADAIAEINEQGMMALRTAGGSRYLFELTEQETNRDLMDRWVRAVRLSCYEYTRIHEIYTKKIIMRHKVIDADDDEEEDLLAKPMPKMEGFLQVRFAGSNEWQKYWVVVSDRRDDKKRLFGKKSVPSRGQLTFYESKKAKHPIMTIVNVVQAYTLYPDTPQLADLATLLKVDGSVATQDSEQNDQQQQPPTSALLMTSNTVELVQWLVGIYDAFKIYGRPSQLLRDPTNVHALNFGETALGARLFLEVDDLDQMNVREEGARDNWEVISNLVLMKVKQQGPRAVGVSGMGPRTNSMPQIAQAAGGMGPRTISMPQIAQNQGYQPAGTRQPRQRTISAEQEQQRMSPRATMMAYSARGSMLPGAAQGLYQSPMQQRASVMPRLQQAQTPAGKQIYASDDSEEDDDDEEGQESEDDEDSVFGDTSKKDNSQKPITSGSTFSIPEIRTEPSGLQDVLESHNETKNSAEAKEESNDDGRFASQDSKAASQLSNEKGKSKTGARPAPSASSDESENEADDDDDDDASSTGGYTPHRPTSRWPRQMHNNKPNNNSASSMYLAQPTDMDEVSYDSFYYQQPRYPQYQYHQQNPVIDEDGPVIPQLGEDFASPNSLLSAARQEHPSVRDQTEYAKATGQPLVHLPYKPPEPQGGLVGMISQIEHNKKDHKGRLLENDRIERERQQQQMMDPRQTMMVREGEGASCNDRLYLR